MDICVSIKIFFIVQTRIPSWLARFVFQLSQNVGQTVSKNAGAVPSNINITFSTAAQYVRRTYSTNCQPKEKWHICLHFRDAMTMCHRTNRSWMMFPLDDVSLKKGFY